MSVVPAKLPASLKGLIQKDIERYEMLGVIDIVTQIELFSSKSHEATS